MGIPDLAIWIGGGVWVATPIMAWFVWGKVRNKVVGKGKIDLSDYGWFFIRMVSLGICFVIGCILIVIGMMGLSPEGPIALADGTFYIAFCSSSAVFVWFLLFLLLTVRLRLALWTQGSNSHDAD